MFKNFKKKPKEISRGLELYNGPVKRSQQNSSRYCQNFEFSRFPLLCREIWKQLMRPLKAQMPYCLFLHAMTEYLNAYLIDVSRCEGVPIGLDNFDSTLQSIEASMNLIPTPIFDYINGIGKVKTAAGVDVYFNLPIGGTPQGPLDATDDEAAMESGSFGSCTAETHNSYECYVSPYITRKLIERTLYANTSTDPGRFDDWSPLPKGRYPQNGIANKNLLGYEKPERLDADGISALRDLDFCNNDTPLGRISHSGKVLSRVTAILLRLPENFNISNAHFYILLQGNSPAKDNSAAFIYINSQNRGIDEMDVNLVSPERFGSKAAYKAYLFGYKRSRSTLHMELCYTLDGNVSKSWKITGNDNFNMLGAFAPRPGLHDKASLRKDHVKELIKDPLAGVIMKWLLMFNKHY